MEINIQSLHFDASSQLIDFINKKVAKLGQYMEGIVSAEVTLSLSKSDEKSNKVAGIKLLVPDGELFASKQTETFEESVALTVDALVKQISKYKEKQG